MRSIFSILFFVVLFCPGCNDPNAPNCLQSAGEVRTFDIEVEEFSEVEINDNFAVTIQQDAEQSLSITIGENLINDTRVENIDGKLVISDNNGCRWVRDYEFPHVVITTPDLTRIRQNGGGIIRSVGVLNFHNLVLISEERTGDFELQVECQQLRITNNDLSNYYISGVVENLYVGFFAGDGRFEGEGLQASNAEVFHRGTNDMIISATGALTGRIISNGNVIYTKTVPQVIDGNIEGRGELIFIE